MDEVQVGFCLMGFSRNLCLVYGRRCLGILKTRSIFSSIRYSANRHFNLYREWAIASALYLLPAYFLCDGVPERRIIFTPLPLSHAFVPRGYIESPFNGSRNSGNQARRPLFLPASFPRQFIWFLCRKRLSGFFQERVCVWNGSSVEKQADLTNASLEQLFFFAIMPLRDGSVLWGSKHVALAMHFFVVYGGSVLTDGVAYAFCESREARELHLLMVNFSLRTGRAGALPVCTGCYCIISLIAYVYVSFSTGLVCRSGTL